MLILDGEEVEVSGLEVKNWHQVPEYGLVRGEDCRDRWTSWVRGIVLHTTLGRPDAKQILPGVGPHSRAAKRIGKWWARDGRRAGAHLMLDLDGTWACMADLVRDCAFHAGAVSDCTIGIEVYQADDQGTLYEAQLESLLVMVDFLTRRLGIQRQYQDPYVGPIQRLRNGGADCVGIYGHRDVTSTRGRGDPGDEVFEVLRLAGYEAVDFARETDLGLWKARQEELNRAWNGSLVVDGVPGPATVAHLALGSDRPWGLWVSRPGD